MMIAARMTGDMVLFAEVVGAGTITGGSKRLGLERSTVSRRITSLEERLGVSLLKRSTRRLHLTEAGHQYYQHCLRVVEAAEDAEAAAQGYQVDPSGQLAIAAIIPEADSLLSALIAGFMEQHPTLSIELKLVESANEPAAYAADLTLFAGDPGLAGGSAEKIGALPEHLWATPEFLRSSGLNGSPEGLQQVPTIGLAQDADRLQWGLQAAHARVQLNIAPRLRVNTLKACRESCIAGLGVAKLPEYLCRAAEQRGQLIRLYPDWQINGTPLFTLHRETRFLTRRARVFVDYMRSALAH